MKNLLNLNISPNPQSVKQFASNERVILPGITISIPLLFVLVT